MDFDEQAMKTWLVGLLPAGWSRQDVADELEVERKTVSSMLSLSSRSFGQGRTLIRYLQLTGGLDNAPDSSPAASRLARVEDKVDGLVRTLDDVAAVVREHLPPSASQEQGTGG